eukprot:365079_1
MLHLDFNGSSTTCIGSMIPMTPMTHGGTTPMTPGGSTPITAGGVTTMTPGMAPPGVTPLTPGMEGRRSRWDETPHMKAARSTPLTADMTSGGMTPSGMTTGQFTSGAIPG